MIPSDNGTSPIVFIAAAAAVVVIVVVVKGALVTALLQPAAALTVTPISETACLKHYVAVCACASP